MWHVAATVAPASVQAEQWDLMARSKVESVRTAFSWARAQPVEGKVPNFGGTHRVVALAAARRIQLLPIVYKTPPWARREPHEASPPALSRRTRRISRPWFSARSEWELLAGAPGAPVPAGARVADLERAASGGVLARFG
jgi:hypothetical protein